MGVFTEQPTINDTPVVTSPVHVNNIQEGSATQLVPLLFYDVYQDIALELVEQPNISIVKAEVNKVIRRINHEIGLWRQLVQISPSQFKTSIDLMTTTIKDA